jgi:hypothetical protein
MLLKVEKACHLTPHKKKERASKIQPRKLQIEIIEE